MSATTGNRPALVTRRRLLLLLTVCALATLVRTAGSLSNANGQAEAVSVHYGSGWNLVAVPTAQELTNAAGPQYTFGADGKGYVTAQPGELVGGRGAWTFFSRDTTLALGRSAAAFTRIFTMPDQWALIGNPSTVNTLSISGADAALAYDPTQGYYQVNQLAPGQGAWVLRFDGGEVTVGTAPTGADAVTVRQLQQDLTANPTSRTTLDRVVSTTADLVSNGHFDQVQSATDDLRSAFEDGLRLQSATPLPQMPAAEAMSAATVRDSLAQAQTAELAGNQTVASQQVAAAQQAAAVAEATGVSQAQGQTMLTTMAVHAGRVDRPAQTSGNLARYGALMRAAFFAFGLGQPAPQTFWDVANALLNGTPVPAPSPSPTPQPTPQPVSQPTITPTVVQPKLFTLTPQSGGPGQPVTVQASGFTPGQQASVLFGSGLVLSTVVASDGTLIGTFAVPNQPTGVYVVTLVTPADGSVNAPFTLIGHQVTQPTPSPTPCISNYSRQQHCP